MAADAKNSGADRGWVQQPRLAQQTTALIRGILATSGLFEVTVSTAAQKRRTIRHGRRGVFEIFTTYDVVIQNCNDINHGPSWPEAVQAGL